MCRTLKFAGLVKGPQEKDSLEGGNAVAESVEELLKVVEGVMG